MSTFDFSDIYERERRDALGGSEESVFDHPTIDAMQAAVPRLASRLAEYHQAGRLREARRFWMDCARELEPSRRAKAAAVLTMALDRLGAGEPP